MEEYTKKKRNTIKELIDEYNKNWEEYFGQSNHINIDPSKEDIENEFCGEDKCNKCGKCCNSFPCVFSPRDFLDIHDTEYMINIFKTGLVIFAYSEHYKIILRPRGIHDRYPMGHAIGDYIPQGKNPCLLMSENGCLLPDLLRPSQGLLLFLTDKEHFKHEAIYQDYFFEKEYNEYQKYLHDLLIEYQEKVKAIPNGSIEKRSNDLIKALINKKD